MRRLCTHSSCSYSGRSAWHAAESGHGSRTEDYVERHRETHRTLPPVLGSAPRGNAGRDRAEVSRRHSSQTPTVMGGTG